MKKGDSVIVVWLNGRTTKATYHGPDEGNSDRVMVIYESGPIPASVEKSMVAPEGELPEYKKMTPAERKAWRNRYNY